MSNLMNFNYNGQMIQRRENDGFVNLTQMCQANGKRLDNYFRLKQTQRYLSTARNYLGCEVVSMEEGANGGTWGHPSLAINLARWLSDEFALWCDSHIFNLMESGSTSLDTDPLEEMRLKVELAKYEAQKEDAIAKSQQLRYTITTTCPEPVQQKVLGYETVEKVEYRDRVIQDSDIVRDGSTVNKTELCERYGIVTRNGKPDYKTLNKMLSHLPEEAWDEQMTVRTNKEIKREYLPELDQLLTDGSNRQLFLGE